MRFAIVVFMQKTLNQPPLIHGGLANIMACKLFTYLKGCNYVVLLVLLK